MLALFPQFISDGVSDFPAEIQWLTEVIICHFKGVTEAGEVAGCPSHCSSVTQTAVTRATLREGI